MPPMPNGAGPSTLSTLMIRVLTTAYTSLTALRKVIEWWLVERAATAVVDADVAEVGQFELAKNEPGLQSALGPPTPVLNTKRAPTRKPRALQYTISTRGG